ncbi:FAS1-like dehydratase domain-containing protein [Streptomyces anulatus]|uniref:FAS1-like dehydratase domain-containing protein n=1 Tax=Streptomyces anulatus TaxID=1892 RepID=UPI00372494CA
MGTRPGRSRPDEERAATVLNPDYEGRTLHLVLEHRVSEEELVAFADAVGETHPACRDADAAHRLGHPAVIAPPTYPASLALRAERPLFDDPGLGADNRSLRHRDTAVTVHRPVHAGDVLRCTVRVVAVEALGRAGILVTEVTVEASGEPVAVVRNTVVTGPG